MLTRVEEITSDLVVNEISGSDGRFMRVTVTDGGPTAYSELDRREVERLRDVCEEWLR